MTNKELKELKRLADAASDGPWTPIEHPDGVQIPEVLAYSDGCVGSLKLYLEADGQFIAASREAVPNLIAEIERLTEELKELKRLADSVPSLLAEIQRLREIEGDYKYNLIDAATGPEQMSGSYESVLKSSLKEQYEQYDKELAAEQMTSAPGNGTYQSQVPDGHPAVYALIGGGGGSGIHKAETLKQQYEQYDKELAASPPRKLNADGLSSTAVMSAGLFNDDED